ncbi:MAG TPA: putative ABC exporter domain-containing protein, partial [Gemmatimonadaceae bacterium]|nr:putative ABC exporter domain-containing protein [Gemmatimonadaceae bacterium]
MTDEPDAPAAGAAGAFAWLIARTARNRARAQLRRLRQPRYALGLVLAAGYLWLVYLRPRHSAIEGAGIPSLATEAVVLFFSLVLFAFAAWWWVMGAPRTALTFTPAEVQLLFPAPLVRRELILYKLMKAHSAMLVMSLVFGVLLRRGLGDVPMLMRAFGLFVLYATLHLHQLGVSLSREGLAGRGTGRIRSLLPLVLFLGLLATLVASVARAYDATPSPGMDLWVERVVAPFRAPAASLVLLPARVALGPAFAASVGDWLRSVGPAVLLLLAHYVWVLRADA